MKNTRVLRRTRRAGLTLIELIVVLAILVALGGIAVAVAPDLIKRAHVAEHVTNASGVETAVQTNRLTAGSIGNNFDSLVNATPAVYTGLPGAANYELLALTADDVTALSTIGVTGVVDGSATPTNATFDYANYAAPTIRNLAATGNVCAVVAASEPALRAQFNIPTTAGARYVVLGIGPACSLVGANGALSEAPVHFGESEATRANNAYARYLVVVELTAAGTANAEARLLGVAVAHDDGPARASGALAEWYE